MKRLWIAVALLCTVFLLTLGNTVYLGRFTGDLTALLTEAELRGEQGRWDTALKLTRQAEALWKDHDVYLHVTLRHADTDAIYLSFRQVTEFLHCREGGEYSAANAVLLGQIGLLYEQEQFDLKNLL